MTYNRPEVLKLDNALHSIQGGTKFSTMLPDSMPGNEDNRRRVRGR